MIKKILIANRGEIAVRIIKTCNKLGIKTVSVYTEEDENSIHTKISDDKICIGKNKSTFSYLNISNIIMSAKKTKCDAIHPGYGFLSENAEISKVCKEEGIIFIGADEDNILKMGNKSNARDIVEKLGVPIIKGYPNITEENIDLKVNEVGLPIIMKATSGGGGKGMRIVRDIENLKLNLQQSKKESKNAFDDENIYIEKYIENAKHIEIQILSDNYGNIYSLGERDCTIQRNYQKLIEETPSPFINDDIRNELSKLSCKIIKKTGYIGVGTIEFLLDKDKNFYFIEMNTRIQVEHTITEELYGIDLIKLQIDIANKKEIKEKFIPQKKHIIECRINAEDSENNFIPSSGKINKLELPKNIRIDTHIYEGYKISPFYDSMIAKVIIKGKDREDSINKMRYSLENFKIEGIKTTIPLHKKILKNIKFIEGDYYANFLKLNIKKL